MPGVPFSRGCAGCRKQKKKCDAVRPPCARCRRVDIPCVGLGQQRYTFKDEAKKLAHHPKKRSTSTTHEDEISNAAHEALLAIGPSQNLSNNLTRLTSAFINNIDPSKDIKIQLPWNFGGFLEDVPRRLGVNEALDAASDALVTAYTSFCAGHIGPTPEVLIKHSCALNALRLCLDDPIKAYSSETLCAIMLLLIHQVFIGADGNPLSHSAGAAQILKSRGYSGPRDDFENKLLLFLRSTVAVQALMTDKICFTQQDWKNLVSNELDSVSGGNTDGEMMRCLARIPDLMQRGRQALRYCMLYPSAVLDIRDEVRALREDFTPIMTSLRARLNEHNLTTASPSIGPANLIHAHYTRTYGLGLTIGIIINCILCALEDSDSVAELRQEASRMSDEILQLADVVRRYRPLGALYIVLCLSAAYIGVTEESTRRRIIALFVDYHADVWVPMEANSLVACMDWSAKRFALEA